MNERAELERVLPRRRWMAGVASATAAGWSGCRREPPRGLEQGEPRLCGDSGEQRLDAHQHFWDYDPATHPWIVAGSAVARSFTPEQLKPQLRSAGVAGTVLVESRSHLDETQRLLSIASREPVVRGVVGWLPLRDPAVADVIARFGGGLGLCGARHAVLAEPDPEFLEREDFNRGIRELTRAGLAFDLLLVPRNLPAAIRFVDRHPNQRFVLDHLAKPAVRSQELQPWKHDFLELAKRPHVYCKLSGLVNEADHRLWTPAQLSPYLEVALAAFTPERLMFGSDWPMCLMASSYQRWVDTLGAALERLGGGERARIWGGTAREAYRLS